MMQLKTALAEAQRRWGKNAGVKRSKCRLATNGKDAGKCSGWLDKHRDCPGGKPICTVGRIEMGLFFMVKGTGATFEAAFADASNREAADRARYCRARGSHGAARRCRICKYRGPPEREGLGELQPDGTLLTTAERIATWERECAEAKARRDAEKAEVEARRAKRQAEARMMEGREPTTADVEATA